MIIDPKELGHRLLELRKSLNEVTGENWSQDKLADELNVTKNVIFRLEKGQGSIEKFVKLLQFYHDKGFNVVWLIDPEAPKRKFLDVAPKDAKKAEG